MPPYQERVTMQMLYEKLEEISQKISTVDKAQAVNATQIIGLQNGLGVVCDDIKELRKRSDRWDAIVAAVSMAGATLAAFWGSNK